MEELKKLKAPVQEAIPWIWRLMGVVLFITLLSNVAIFLIAAVGFWTDLDMIGKDIIFILWVFLICLAGIELIFVLISALVSFSYWWSTSDTEKGTPEFLKLRSVNIYFSDMYISLWGISGLATTVIFGFVLRLYNICYSLGANHPFKSHGSGAVPFGNSLTDPKQNECYHRTYDILLLVIIGIGSLIFFTWYFRFRLWQLFSDNTKAKMFDHWTLTQRKIGTGMIKLSNKQ